MKIDKERDVIIDYLTVTYPLNTDLTSSLKFQHYELLDYICTFLNYEPCEVYKEPYAKNNFRHEFTLGGVAILRFDGPENKYHQATAMIELKGEACRDFERRNTDKKWVDLLIFLNSLNCNYKRIDLTIDDYKGDITIVVTKQMLLLHIECKNQKQWSLPKWIAQAEEDCPEGRTPIVIFHKHNTSKDYVCLSLEDFFSLVEKQKVVGKRVFKK